MSPFHKEKYRLLDYATSCLFFIKLDYANVSSDKTKKKKKSFEFESYKLNKQQLNNNNKKTM